MKSLDTYFAELELLEDAPRPERLALLAEAAAAYPEYFAWHLRKGDLRRRAGDNPFVTTIAAALRPQPVEPTPHRPGLLWLLPGMVSALLLMM